VRQSEGSERSELLNGVLYDKVKAANEARFIML